MVRMQIVLFAASLLLSSAGRVQRRQHVQDVTEKAASEVEERAASGVGANRTKFNWSDKCYADKKSLLHLAGYWISLISPANLVFPLYGWSTPPIYKMGDCEFKAEAGIMLTLEGVGDISVDYDCTYPGSNRGASCNNDCVFGKSCHWPMNTKFKFNSPIGLRLSAGADLNLCGISTGNLNNINVSSPLEIGVGASVQITDVDMRTNDKYDCTGLIYQGFRGEAQVTGGHITWNGLHCVIDGLALMGLSMTSKFQEHCTNFLNKLLSHAQSWLKQKLSQKVAEERPTR